MGGDPGVLKQCTIVFDVGKTNAKLTLWDAAGRQLQRRVRPNDIVARDYRALDADGLESWLVATLSEFARNADVGAIVPVGHGAAAALVSKGQLFAPPMDYEEDIDPLERERYATQRDAFSPTGSPALPQGLNLGLQLHRLEQLTGPWPDDLHILPWPQYWAWRLCGVMATEVTSLGCHSDLWRPLEQRYSDLARHRGWDRRFAPLRRADEPLGTLSPEWISRTGLPRHCVVLCGLHDSNAALLAARGHAAIADNDATVLSTGTWFVAMRSPSNDSRVDTAALAEERDCLINVDVHGRPVPSARFMGGREAELIGGLDIHALTVNYEPRRLIERLPSVLEAGAAALPTFARGVGPFPRSIGEWRNKPQDPGDQRAITGLYLALMADASLGLIGSRDRLLIEGRFAEAVIFIRALAALRPRQQVFISNAHDDVPYGALRLIHPALRPAASLIAVQPLDVDFSDYARAWREHADRSVA
jgi:sugar (pentulose or hexulose) kinase